MDQWHNTVIRGVYQRIEDNGDLYQVDMDIRIALIRTEDNPEWHWSDKYVASGIAPGQTIKWGDN